MASGSGALPEVGQELARSEQALRSSARSHSSSSQEAEAEARDDLEQRQRVHQALERQSRSSASSVSGRSAESPKEQDNTSDAGSSHCSEGTTNSARAVYRSGALRQGRQVGGASASSSSGSRSGHHISSDQVALDKVDAAIRQAKRAAERSAAKAAAGRGHGKGGDTGSALSSSGSGGGSQIGTHSNTTFAEGSGTLPTPPTSAPAAAAAPPPSMLPASLLEALPPGARDMVDAFVQKLIAKTGNDLANVQAHMDALRVENSDAHGQMGELVAKVAIMQAKEARDDAAQDPLASSRAYSRGLEDERGDLLDRMAGLEARIEARTERHDANMDKVKKRNLAERNDADAKHEITRIELAESRRENDKARTQAVQVANEEAAIRRGGVIRAEAHAAELHMLESELSAARREIRRQGTEIAGAAKSPWDDFEDQRILEETLKESRDQNAKMSSTLTELRLQLLQANQARSVEADAEEQARGRNVGRVGKSGKDQSSGSRLKKVSPAHKLTSIDEDLGVDDVASQAGSQISGQVSSADGEIGNLDDFDDRRKPLSSITRDQAGASTAETKLLAANFQLAEAESLCALLKDQQAATDAQNASKVARMQQLLDTSRLETDGGRAEMLLMQQASTIAEAASLQEVANMSRVIKRLQEEQRCSDANGAMVNEMQELTLAYATQLDDARQQLAFALESNRLLTIRLEDTKRELQSTQARHQRVVEGLTCRLEMAGALEEFQEEDTSSNARVELLVMEEERNVLKDELECQRVHFEAQCDHEQQQYEVAMTELREQEAMAERDRLRMRTIEEKLMQKQTDLPPVRKAEDIDMEAASAKKAQHATGVGPAWLSLLRCPTRSGDRDPAARAVPSSDCAGSGQFQAMLWQVVNAISGTTALVCHGETLAILEASRQAVSLWGSAALRDSSLPGLVFDDTASQWLEAELQSSGSFEFNPSRAIPGFWLRELGCIEFRSKLGSAFESSVTCARLPEEPPNRPFAIVVIVEPIEERRTQRKNVPQRHDQPSSRPVLQQRGTPSAASSVHSDDITANDSVSNVNARY